MRPRLVSWLGKYGHNEDVVAFANEMTAAALADQEVDPDVLSACLQVTAIDGDWKLYNAYKKRVENAATPALSCSIEK